MERNIQKKWCTEYGKIDETETESIEALNEFVKCLNGACIATTRRECKEWIERMKWCESQFREEDDGETPVSDYVKEDVWVGMCERSESLQSLPHPGDLDDSTDEEKKGCVEWWESSGSCG